MDTDQVGQDSSATDIALGFARRAGRETMSALQGVDCGHPYPDPTICLGSTPDPGEPPYHG